MISKDFRGHLTEFQQLNAADKLVFFVLALKGNYEEAEF
jgi:hypothetical protein